MTIEANEFLDEFLREAEYGQDHAERFMGEAIAAMPDDVELIKIITDHVDWDTIVHDYTGNYIPDSVVEYLIDSNNLSKKVRYAFMYRLGSGDITDPELIKKYITYDRNYQDFTFRTHFRYIDKKTVKEILIPLATSWEDIKYFEKFSLFSDQVNDAEMMLFIADQLRSIETFYNEFGEQGVFDMLMDGKRKENFKEEEYWKIIKEFPETLDLSKAEGYYSEEYIMENPDKFKNIAEISLYDRSLDFTLHCRNRMLVEKKDDPRFTPKYILDFVFINLRWKDIVLPDEFLSHFYSDFIEFGVPEYLIENKDKYKHNDTLQLMIKNS